MPGEENQGPGIGERVGFAVGERVGRSIGRRIMSRIGNFGNPAANRRHTSRRGTAARTLVRTLDSHTSQIPLRHTSLRDLGYSDDEESVHSRFWSEGEGSDGRVSPPRRSSL
jgi:hypothetical protein